MLHAAPCRGQSAASAKSSPVLFLEHPELTPSDADLFTAVRAQLSGASLTLERVLPPVPPVAGSGEDLSAVAPDLAAEYDAALVFWIEDRDPCRIHFFVPDTEGGQFSSRVVDVELNNPASRYDVIAVVVAAMIEGLLVPSASPAETPSEATPLPPKEAPQKEAAPAREGRRRIELHLAYAGLLTAPRTVAHGGTLGVGFSPLRRLFLGVAFGLYAPSTLSNDVLQVRLTSRQLDVQAAVGWFPSPVEVRLGLSYSVDFRSFSTAGLDDTIHPREDGYSVVHSFVPFLFASWTYRERVGIFGKVGASLSVNETVFRIRRATGEYTEELAPFDVKFVYQLGLLIQL